MLKDCIEMTVKEKVILLVEDNPDDVALTLMAFKKNNILNEVVVAEDGEDALSWLFAEGSYRERDSSILPQLVLLDLKLPKVDGLEVLRKIRSNAMTRFLPVVILTSSKEDRDLISGYEFGANSYIRKPVDFAQFSESIKQLGLFWLVLNEAPPVKLA